MLLAGHDPEGEDHEGPAAASALAHLMIDVRLIRAMIENYLTAMSKAARVGQRG